MAQNKFIAIFQIGPVQDFISTARKTADFWAGSYLLSYLTKTVIDYVQNEGAEIIYPSFASLSPSNETPNIPNRFVVEFDSQKLNGKQPEEIMKNAEKEVKNEFLKITTTVKSAVEAGVNNNIQDKSFWDEIFQRQAENLFDVYWVVYPEDEAEFSKSHSEAEVIFNARKSIRDFKQMEGEKGFKCTMCGKRETLNDKYDGSLNRKHLNQFWDRIRQVDSFKFKFNEDEHLCAVCTVKRFLGEAFNIQVNIPSTASIAASSFVNRLISQIDDVSFDVKDFIEKISKISKDNNMPKFGVALDKLNALADYNKKDLAKLEGGWYYEDTYNNLINKNPKKATEVTPTLNKLKEIYKKTGFPSKYYAIIQVDGDNIGESLRNKNKDELKEFSKKIFEFSSKMINEIEKKFLAKVVYFGGDEGVIFSSLSDLLPIIDFIRKEFNSSITDTTISFGVTIAHYKDALQKVINDSRRIIKEAKNSRKEKNALGISIIKRSGESALALIHLNDKDHSFDMVNFLSTLIDWYTQEKISKKWWIDIAKEGTSYVYKDKDNNLNLDKDILKSEIKRLFKRRVKKGVNEAEINAILNDFYDFVSLLQMENGLSFFINFMEIAEFIAREG